MKGAKHAAYSVWLYGSHARGDSDRFSDIDIFVAGALPDGNVIKSLAFDGQPLSVSQYSWEEVGAMADYGSLFLHHLRLEGKPLLESAGTCRLVRLLEHLVSYKLFRRDLGAFRLTIADIREGFRAGSTPEFEMAVLGTVLRHSSVLGCYLLGRPCFGRTEAIERVGEAVGLTPETVRAFTILYLFRLREDGRCEAPFEPSWDDVRESCYQTEIFLCRLNEVADAFERRLPEADCESQSQHC